jgi:hypothetical protein
LRWSILQYGFEPKEDLHVEEENKPGEIVAQAAPGFSQLTLPFVLAL